MAFRRSVKKVAKSVVSKPAPVVSGKRKVIDNSGARDDRFNDLENMDVIHDAPEVYY